MKRYLLLILLVSSCRTTLILDKEDVKGIKYGSDKVIIHSKSSADTLFSQIARDLSSRMWIVKEARAASMISCDPRMVKGDIYLKPIIKISSSSKGSIATYSGFWSPRKMEQDQIDLIITKAPNNVTPIRWEGYKTVPGLAFQNLIMMAKRIPSDSITFTN